MLPFFASEKLPPVKAFATQTAKVRSLAMPWHDPSLDPLASELAHWYPTTYGKIGDQLRSGRRLASQTGSLRSEALAIIAATPGNVQPWRRATGDRTPWPLLEWLDFLERLPD